MTEVRPQVTPPGPRLRYFCPGLGLRYHWSHLGSRRYLPDQDPFRTSDTSILDTSNLGNPESRHSPVGPRTQMSLTGHRTPISLDGPQLKWLSTDRNLRYFSPQLKWEEGGVYIIEKGTTWRVQNPVPLRLLYFDRKDERNYVEKNKETRCFHDIGEST